MNVLVEAHRYQAHSVTAGYRRGLSKITNKYHTPTLTWKDNVNIYLGRSKMISVKARTGSKGFFATVIPICKHDEKERGEIMDR